MPKVNSGGGFRAIWYTLKKSREVGGIWKMFQAMRTKNACKTCALGMGGQKGGMVNEAGSFPEFCKKSLQAMAADMQGAIKPEFWSTYSVPQLQQFSPLDLETCGRLTQPVVLEKGSQYYKPISWDEAFARITGKLKQLTANETFWYFSGRSSNEAGFLLQLFARLYGTNNVNNCSFYCHQASGVGLTTTLGTGTATVTLHDVEKADLVFLIGGNPPSNHPRLMSSLMMVRNKGGKVISINPVIETGLVSFRVPSNMWSLFFGTKVSSTYVQPHIGGDLALLVGIAKRVVELKAHDETYLREYCEGSEAWLANLAATPWDEIERKSGVDFAQIDDMAKQYAAAKRVNFCWTMGITHHANGVENVQAIVNLALLRGMIGKEGCGVMPIRGHSNVQGIGSMGVTPKLKDSVFAALEREFAVQLPTTKGLDTLGCMEESFAERLKFGLCLGGNLYGSNPEATFAGQALAKLETLVYMSTTLNTGHAHGLGQETIILPVLARDEEPQATTQESMFNYVRLSDGGPARHEGPKSEVEVVATMASQTLGNDGPIDWSSMQNTGKIRDAIAKVVPGFEQLATIDETKKEFQIPGRTFHTPKFPTPSGKAIMHVHQIPELRGEGDQLRLMTVRSEGQFNTVVYETEDLYRNQTRRDVILLHPDDVERLGFEEDQRVTITSEVGEMKNILIRPYPAIRAGNALMYYPEANVLVPRTADPYSKTPAFKNILITVSAQTPQTKSLPADRLLKIS
ncbi:FdhF/YdeP family oxidoreductase [Anatilimnocola sp. NA78]|uniref:FdhF/YdeP family oxidoreductase n=1 Tax=Anatilimnocola sp. NA78 TaxID=3415683 RepID=UPI003CE4F9EF